MARFDSGRCATYAQRERKRYGAESKGEGGTFQAIAGRGLSWTHDPGGRGIASAARTGDSRRTVPVELLLRHLSDDRVQRGAGAHRRVGLRGIGPVIAAHVDRPPLRRDQLRVDLRRVVAELLRDLRELRLEFLVLRLLGERLRPVEREVEVAAAVVDLADLAGGGLVVVE